MRLRSRGLKPSTVRKKHVQRRRKQNETVAPPAIRGKTVEERAAQARSASEAPPRHQETVKKSQTMFVVSGCAIAFPFFLILHFAQQASHPSRTTYRREKRSHCGSNEENANDYGPTFHPYDALAGFVFNRALPLLNLAGHAHSCALDRSKPHHGPSI